MISLADQAGGWVCVWAGWVGWDKKHEIYAVAFGGRLFYDLFLQARGAWPLAPRPRIRYWS